MFPLSLLLEKQKTAYNAMEQKEYFNGLCSKLNHLYCSLRMLVLECIYPSIKACVLFLLRYIAFELDPFWMHLSYFVVVPFLGYLVLRSLEPRFTSTDSSSTSYPEDFDIFFTSISSMTESSMSAVEMEFFSTPQLMVLLVLMLCGGEVFTSMIGLQLRRSKFTRLRDYGPTDHHKASMLSGDTNVGHDHVVSSINIVSSNQIINFSSTPPPPPPHPPPINVVTSIEDELNRIGDHIIVVELPKVAAAPPPTNYDQQHQQQQQSPANYNLKHKSMKSLTFVILGYLVVIHAIGSSLVSLYFSLSSSASDVLKRKGLSVQTFSVFLTVSTFANSGFLPNNENMAAFKENSGLQMILLPQILLGNSLYPCCLWLVVWVLERLSKREDYAYILNNYDEMGYAHLMSGFNSCMLAMTTIGFIVLQFVLICAMEWESEALEGLNSFQKLIGSLFQATNTRHSGESIIDLSIVSPAVLVLLIVMMFLPPYIMFIPKRKSSEKKDAKENKDRRKKLQRRSIILDKYLIFSPLSYLVIFIILICITERNGFTEDPLNFNVLTVVLEVISAYGNVGYSMCYSCKRRLKFDPSCKDAAYGFVGRWSTPGKFIIILVMLFGRLKRFSMQGGQGWHLK